MDFKKLAFFIIILGMLFLGYGGFKLMTNQPKKFDKSESKSAGIFGRDDFSNYFNVQSINQVRKNNREEAVIIMIIGGIVVFVGVGVSASAKKKDE